MSGGLCIIVWRVASGGFFYLYGCGYSSLALYFFFFFFQAEDGIRDLTVTGVQTCALPISGAGIKTISVDTGDRDDSIALDPTTIPSTVTEDLDGGGGNDSVSGANSPGTDRKSVV